MSGPDVQLKLKKSILTTRMLPFMLPVRLTNVYGFTCVTVTPDKNHLFPANRSLISADLTL